MKITFIGHAAIIVETNGIKILSDPWWEHPCFGAQWWTYPLPFTNCIDLNSIDFIYISHGHHDHFHPGTLKKFKHSCKILVSTDIDLKNEIEKLGFEVISVSPDSTVNLAENVSCTIWPTYGGDTLMVIDDGEEVCINANDAIHAAPVEVQDYFISKIKQSFPKVDYLFCGYGVASHFPNCYQIPYKNDYQTAFQRQKYFNSMWVRIVANLSPNFAFPFAADVALLENDLYYANEPTQKAALELMQDFRSRYPDIVTQTAHIAPGFVIENKKVTANVIRTCVNMEVFKNNLESQIELANRYGDVDESYIQSLVDLVKENISICKSYLIEYDDDYNFGISLRNTKNMLFIEKRGSDFLVSNTKLGDVSVDVMLITRASYLKQSLTKPFGSEILFVGSGGIFRYFDKNKIHKNLHNELKVIVTFHKNCPGSRFGKDGKFVFTIKKYIKRLLNINESDLYDLKKWIVFND